MLNFFDPSGLRLCDGVSRRQCLRVGSLALGGITLPELLSAQGRQSAHEKRIMDEPSPSLCSA